MASQEEPVDDGVSCSSVQSDKGQWGTTTERGLSKDPDILKDFRYSNKDRKTDWRLNRDAVKTCPGIKHHQTPLGDSMLPRSSRVIHFCRPCIVLLYCFGSN